MAREYRGGNAGSAWLAVACCLALVPSIGCESGGSTTDGPRQTEQVWSTRDRSIAGRSAEANGQLGEHTIPVDFDRPTVHESAVDVLRQAAESTNPLLRAHAIEAIQYAPNDAKPIVQQALGDSNRGVRFTAIMTVGDLELCELSSLVRPLLHDESQSVQAASIYALTQCDEDVDPGPLASMIFSENPEVRANAAIVLGRIGNPSAMTMLRSAVGREMPRVPPERVRIIDLQIAEAIVMLGDDRQLDVIRAALFAPVAEHGEVVTLACQMVGRLNDRRAASNLHNLATREGRRQLPPEIRLAATEALAQIDPGAAPIGVAVQYADSERFDHRAQAAATLGAIDHPAAINALEQLLTDSNPIVQIAAAGGLLRQIRQHERASVEP